MKDFLCGKFIFPNWFWSGTDSNNNNDRQLY